MEKYRKISYWALGILSVIVFLLLFKYILGITLPFLIALLIVSLSRPTINKICRKTKASKFFVTVFVISIVMVLIIGALILLISAVVEQIGNIANGLIENLSKEENYVTRIFEIISKLEEKIPFINNITNETIYSLVTDMITQGVKNLSLKATNIMAKIITTLPQIMLTIIVIILSIFYFAKDYDKMGKRLMKIMPKSLAGKAPKIKNDILLVISKYIKSYILLLILTFAILFSGFLILGIKNSFVLAMIISFIDFLPILGVGTALIPWAIVLFISGNTGTGIGILIIFAVSYIVRQYAEPKILSGQMEVHPLITLFTMYAGLKVAGIIGLVFAPLVAFIGKTLYINLKKPENSEKTVDNSN